MAPSTDPHRRPARERICLPPSPGPGRRAAGTADPSRLRVCVLVCDRVLDPDDGPGGPGCDVALLRRPALRRAANRAAGRSGDRLAQLAVWLQRRLPRVGGEGLPTGTRPPGPDDQRQRAKRRGGDPGVSGRNHAIARDHRPGRRDQGSLPAGAGRRHGSPAAGGGRRLPLGRREGVRRRPHVAPGKSAGKPRIRGGLKMGA